MALLNNLHVISFNCEGVKSILPEIYELCETADIVLLQETWLFPHEIDLLNNVHPAFYGFSLSSMDVGAGLVVGRPRGGVSILWRKSLGHSCQVIQFDDSRILGRSLKIDNATYIILNVYLPYCSHENWPDYLLYMGKLASIIDNSEADGIAVIGDFNCDPYKNTHSSFFRELDQLCNIRDLVIADTCRLPQDSYTHVNNGNLSQSWLDHCIVSPILNQALTNISIDNTYCGSDHFPLHLLFNLNFVYKKYEVENVDILDINWNFSDTQKSNMFFENLYIQIRALELIESCLPFFCNSKCDNCNHKYLSKLKYEELENTVRRVGKQVFGTKRRNGHNVPGWNNYVRELYRVSKEAFSWWKINGSPRVGPVAQHMRRARADFKYALRYCRRNEEALRAEALSNKLQMGQTINFWQDIRYLNAKTHTLPDRIDGAVGPKEISQLWRTKFSQVLNSVNDSQSKNQYKNKVFNTLDTPVENVTLNELRKIVSKLSNNKAIGKDGIPNEFYKYAPEKVLVFYSLFYKSFIIHSYLPPTILAVLLIPLIKSKLKDQSASSNYRPIAVATAASKIMESILMERLEAYLYTSDNQFGFKSKHSTELCIFALKEVIQYYKHLNTPIFVCFIDIKSAFDRVSFWKLFTKLLDRGTPLHLVELLEYWYTTQQLFIKWGNYESQSFNMSNGIRQGSMLSPYLFNVYVDDLNIKLNGTKVGCYISNRPFNNFSYADDLALVAPSATALNQLLKTCESFASDNYIVFSTTKSVCMSILPKSSTITRKPNIYLANSKLAYVDNFNYLGHTVDSKFSDDEDIGKEARKLCAQGNTIIRKFRFCNVDSKCCLFKTFCYSVYCCSLWANHSVSSMNKIKIIYNNIMRKLVNVPVYSSASFMFASLGVKSFQELRRSTSFSLMQRVLHTENSVIRAIRTSDARLSSNIWRMWSTILYI